MRTKSSPDLANTVATAPVSAVKRSTGKKSRLSARVSSLSVGVARPPMSTLVLPSSKVPGKLAWKALARLAVRWRKSLSVPVIRSASMRVLSLTS